MMMLMFMMLRFCFVLIFVVLCNKHTRDKVQIAMKLSLTNLFCVYWLACWVTYTNSFVVIALHPQTSNSKLLAEGDENNTNSDRPKNMVDTATFVAAVAALEGKPDGSSSEGPYAIGRIQTNLSIVGTPGLDLAEAPGLVLVSGVSGNAQELGIQAGDTIVSIGASEGSYQKETKGLSLEQTATILMEAANHAVESGLTEVELEINRLVKLSYSD